VFGVKVPRKHPRILTAAEMQAILEAYARLRDRLLLVVLHDTGMRIGEALGLRHEDWAAAERTVTVVARVNDNGARAKSAQPRTIPISAGLVRLYADYLHSEYGDLDSDYVFVNFWAGQCGHPLTYAAVYDLVGPGASTDRDRFRPALMPRKNASEPAPSSALVTCSPRISRCPSALTPVATRACTFPSPAALADLPAPGRRRRGRCRAGVERAGAEVRHLRIEVTGHGRDL